MQLVILLCKFQIPNNKVLNGHLVLKSCQLYGVNESKIFYYVFLVVQFFNGVFLQIIKKIPVVKEALISNPTIVNIYDKLLRLNYHLVLLNDIFLA